METRGPNDNLQTLNPIGDWLASLSYGWDSFGAVSLVVAECRRHPKVPVVQAMEMLLYDAHNHRLPPTR